MRFRWILGEHLAIELTSCMEATRVRNISVTLLNDKRVDKNGGARGQEKDALRHLHRRTSSHDIVVDQL